MCRPGLILLGAALGLAAGEVADFHDHVLEDGGYDSEPNYELEFLQSADHEDASPTVHELPLTLDYEHGQGYEQDAPEDSPPPPHIHEEHPEMVRDRWERRMGDLVEGGYTVQEPDGTVHHIRYTENMKTAARRAAQRAAPQKFGTEDHTQEVQSRKNSRTEV